MGYNARMLLRVARLLAINAAVLVALVLVALLAFAAVLDAKAFLDSALRGDRPTLADSPAYSDHAKADRILSDQAKARFAYAPFVGWRHAPIELETLTVGADGLRQHPRGPDKTPGARTLAVFGGSTVWGVGVDDAGTIPAIIERRAPGFLVSNFGEVGHTTRQNVAALINLINTGRAPAVVVFYSGYNDVWVHCRYSPDSLNDHMESTRLGRLVDGDRPRLHLDRFFVQPALQAIRHLMRQRSLPPNACEASPERAEAVAAMTVATWEIARQLTEAAGGEFRLFIQPTAFVGNPRRDYLDLSDGGQYAAVYPLLLRKALASPTLRAVDLTRILDGPEAYYLDTAHISEAGNERAAAAIIESLAAHYPSAGTN